MSWISKARQNFFPSEWNLKNKIQGYGGLLLSVTAVAAGALLLLASYHLLPQSSLDKWLPTGELKELVLSYALLGGGGLGILASAIFIHGTKGNAEENKQREASQPPSQQQIPALNTFQSVGYTLNDYLYQQTVQSSSSSTVHMSLKQVNAGNLQAQLKIDNTETFLQKGELRISEGSTPHAYILRAIDKEGEERKMLIHANGWENTFTFTTQNHKIFQTTYEMNFSETLDFFCNTFGIEQLKVPLKNQKNAIFKASEATL